MSSSNSNSHNSSLKQRSIAPILFAYCSLGLILGFISFCSAFIYVSDRLNKSSVAIPETTLSDRSCPPELNRCAIAIDLVGEKSLNQAIATSIPLETTTTIARNIANICLSQSPLIGDREAVVTSIVAGVFLVSFNSLEAPNSSEVNCLIQHRGSGVFAVFGIRDNILNWSEETSL